MPRIGKQTSNWVEIEVSKFQHVNACEQTGAAKTSRNKLLQLAEPPCTYRQGWTLRRGQQLLFISFRQKRAQKKWKGQVPLLPVGFSSPAIQTAEISMMDATDNAGEAEPESGAKGSLQALLSECWSNHGETKQAELFPRAEVSNLRRRRRMSKSSPGPDGVMLSSHVAEMKCVSATIQFQSGCCRATTLHRNPPQSPDREV